MSTQIAPAAGRRTAAAVVAEARARTSGLTVEEFADEAQRSDAVVVDLREADELATHGRIPGAVHVPRGMLEFRCDPTSPYHEPALDPSRRTLLYCASGGRSALAAGTLADLGYVDVAHLDAGFASWTEAGRPIE